MYVCTKLRLCSYLLQKGFNYEEEKQDRYNPRYNIWLFKSTPELMATVDEYYHRDEFINRTGSYKSDEIAWLTNILTAIQKEASN